MAKKQPKNKAPSKKYAHYKDGKASKPFCPKCGPGVFLSEHKDGRLYCGRCHYVEFKK